MFKYSGYARINHRQEEDEFDTLMTDNFVLDTLKSWKSHKLILNAKQIYELCMGHSHIPLDDEA